MEEKYEEVKNSVTLKGFRPGKIPKNIVVREVGEDYVLEEAIDIYLPEQIFEKLHHFPIPTFF